MSSDSPAIKTTNRGAILDKFVIAGQNILLGFPHPSLYSTHPHPHFGETIGRTTNRVANSKLTNLNGKDYTLYANNGPNNLHGGKVGWGARDWTGPTFVRRGEWDEGVTATKPAGWDESKVQGQQGREGWGYEILSPDGEEGFPGAVVGRVWYFEGRGQKGEVVLDAEYEITWQEDDKSDATETVVGITQHGYFNLNLNQITPTSLADTTAILPTPTYLKLIPESMGIPDGTFAPHPEVPEQPNTPFQLVTSSGARPIDDCFVLNENSSSIKLDTRPQALQTMATLHGDKSGLNLKVQSTEPAFQVYTGVGMDVPGWEAGEVDGEKYEGGEGFGPNSGVCVEPSRYVDAAGREEWRSQARLRKGEVFGCRSRYWGWKD